MVMARNTCVSLLFPCHKVGHEQSIVAGQKVHARTEDARAIARNTYIPLHFRPSQGYQEEDALSSVRSRWRNYMAGPGQLRGQY